MPISLSQGQAFNDLYGQRPVWAIASNPAGSAFNSPMVALFNELNPYVPMSVEFQGAPRSKSRNFSDEFQNASYSFYGNGTGSAYVSSNSFSPTSGYFGAYVSANTGCLNNFDIHDNGTYGYYHAQGGAHTLAQMSVPVVGEANWRQCYDLLLTNSGAIYKEEIGGIYATASAGGRPSIDLNAISGFVSAGSGLWNAGQMAHNRNSKKLLVVQPKTGSNGSSLTFRLHILDLQNKIGRATTTAELKQWITDACANGSNRYKYHDVVFSSSHCYFSATNSYDMLGTRFVLCDNDEVWAFKSSDSAQTSTYNVLWRVNLSAGTYLTGTYTATVTVTYTGSSQYGVYQGPMYGVRHMNADDNSRIALYQPYHQYGAGLNMAIVSTKSAGANDFRYVNYQDTSYGYTVAPSGGPNFVLCGTQNTDSTGPYIGFLDAQTLEGNSISLATHPYLWPSVGGSTNLGGVMVLKVQPTTEWK